MRNDAPTPKPPRRPEPVAAAPPLQAQAEALHAAISELVKVYQYRDRDSICCHDVSVTQCHAIEALMRRGPSSLGDLAAELYLDKSTASRVVATLERKGHVERSAHPDDARALVLRVTSAGRRLCRRIERDQVEQQRLLLAELEPELRETAAGVILRVARAAAGRAGVGTGSACCAPGAECE